MDGVFIDKRGSALNLPQEMIVLYIHDIVLFTSNGALFLHASEVRVPSSRLENTVLHRLQK